MTYDQACDAIDAWRRARPRRAGAGRGGPDGFRLSVTEGARIVATGEGPSLERATIALALALPLPAPAAVPCEPTTPAMGREPSGAIWTERPCSCGRYDCAGPGAW